MGKFLILLGLAIAVIGVLITLGLPIGRMPGDVVYRRGNVAFYFPIVTCILLSILLTVVMNFLRR